jgi:hypothetical protein
VKEHVWKVDHVQDNVGPIPLSKEKMGSGCGSVQSLGHVVSMTNLFGEINSCCRTNEGGMSNLRRWSPQNYLVRL